MKILRNFITIEDLEKRWGIGKNEIVPFVHGIGHDINLWYTREPRLLPNGKQSAIVKRAQYTNGSIVDAEEVLFLESKYPELIKDKTIVICNNEDEEEPEAKNKINDLYRDNLFLAVDLDDKLCPPWDAFFAKRVFITTIPKPESGDYYPPDVLMRRYKLSPAEFIGYLSIHDDLYPYGITSDFYSSGVGIPEKLDMLKDISFHYLEIQKHEKSMEKFHEYDAEFNEHMRFVIHDDNSHSAENTEQSVDDIKMQLTEARVQIAALNKANSLLTEQNQHMAEELASLATDSGEGQPASRTHAATKSRQEKTLSAWKPAIDAMIKVAVRCGENGAALRQQPDFNAMFNDIDAELNDAQMNLFRKALPDEHIDRTGGPRGKVTPS